MGVNSNCQFKPIGAGRSCYQGKTGLIYYPSNSTKGIAIKGTNLRVEVVKY